MGRHRRVSVAICRSHGGHDPQVQVGLEGRGERRMLIRRVGCSVGKEQGALTGETMLAYLLAIPSRSSEKIIGPRINLDDSKAMFQGLEVSRVFT